MTSHSAEGSISMDLNFTPAELAFRDEVRTVPARSAARRHRASASRAAWSCMPRTTRAGRSCSTTAAGARRAWPKQFGGPGWTPVQMHIFDEEAAAAGAPRTIPFGPEDGRARDHGFRHRRAAAALPAAASSAAKSGGARAIPNRARAPTSPRSRRAPSARATTTSSTARRPGPRSASTPTGSSAWCAPIRTRRSSSKASRSC